MKVSQLKFFTLLILFGAITYSADDSLLVKIGSSGIAVEEFKERFELIPQVSEGIKRDLEQKKVDLLYSLIAERLWAKEAEALKLDTSDIMQTTFKTIEKMFVRDALYKIEISDKIQITDEEKLEGLNRSYTNLDFDVLQFKDSVSAFNIYGLLKNGIDFDSAKFILNTSLPVIQVKYGDFNEDVEDILYNLAEGNFTNPIKSSSGWLIFKLLKTQMASVFKKDQTIKKIEEIIHQRRTEKYFNEFYKKFFWGKKVETDGQLFRRLAEKLHNVLSEKKISNSIPDSESIHLDVADLLRIENEFGADTLNMSYVNLESKNVTVKQFLREFFFDGFYSADVKLNVIAAKLNSRTKTFIEHEILANEGYRRGLQNLSEVKSSISMWKNNYLAKILRNVLLDSIKVTEDEVYDYYLNRKRENNHSMMEVNILEILTDSLEVIESALKDLENGIDFCTLASLHTKRQWTKTNGGEFGFFPIAMYGDIGRIAATMKVGEIYGPIKLPEGYSIFKLIDKKENNFDSALSFDQSKEELRKNLTYEKSANFFIDYTVRLANKYGVMINEQLLKNVPINDFNMLVFRQMGFGGQLTAVPMVLPFSEWYLPWKEGKKLIP